MAGETCVDFDFSDILSKIEDKPITKNTNSHVNGFLKPVNYSFDLDIIPNFNPTLSLKDDSSDDDLSVLLDSHQSQNHESPGLVSLAALAKDHFSNTSSSSVTNNFGEDTQDSFLFNLKKDCSDESESLDFLLGGNCEEQGKNVNHGDVLNFLDLKSPTDVSVDNNILKEEFLPKEETLDNELIQDIDLSFCIKKCKDKASEFLPGSLNSDSKDSGFGDFESSLSQYSSSSSNEIITSENIKNDPTAFTVNRAQQSLFSRSIAAKPQIDPSRRRKLNMIKNELLNKKISLPSEQEREQIMKKFLSVIDQSNQCVMTSSFLTIPDLK